MFNIKRYDRQAAVFFRACPVIILMDRLKMWEK